MRGLAFIDKLTVEFAPLAKQSASARMFLYRISADKHRDLNPKLALSVVQEDSIRKPSIEVVYRDKKALRLETGNLKIHDIVQEIQKHARKLQLEEDIKSSS